MKAFNEVQNEKKEEDITHGVDIEKYEDPKNGIIFSIWDFAGHEEYHVAHSFFFSSSCIYLFLFDCFI